MATFLSHQTVHALYWLLFKLLYNGSISLQWHNSQKHVSNGRMEKPESGIRNPEPEPEMETEPEPETELEPELKLRPG